MNYILFNCPILGVHHTQQKKTLLEQALTIKKVHYGPNHPEVASTLFNLAMAKKYLELPLKAFTDLMRAFQIFTTTPGYQNHPHLGLIAFQLKSLIETNSDCAQLLTLIQQPNPQAQQSQTPDELQAQADSPEWQDNPDFQAFVGHHCLADNQPELALQYYELAIALAPTETKVFHNAACCYHITGKIEQAKHRFEQGVKHQPTAGIHIEYAHFLVQQGNFQLALQHIDKSKKFPASELDYGLTEKPVIHPLLQTLLESHNELVLATNGLGLFLAYCCHQALNQSEQAKEALNQLQLTAEQNESELLAELAALTLSLSFVPSTNTPTQQQALHKKQEQNSEGMKEKEPPVSDNTNMPLQPETTSEQATCVEEMATQRCLSIKMSPRISSYRH